MQFFLKGKMVDDMLSEFFVAPDLDIDTIINTEDNFIVFGAGNAGRCAIRHLRGKGKRILFICDNDRDKQGTQVDGINIVSPEILVKSQEQLILIASDFANEIAWQVKNFGCNRFYYFGYCFDYERWHNHFDAQFIKSSSCRIKEAYSLFEDEHSREIFRGLIQLRTTFSPIGVKTSSFSEYFHPKVLPQIGDTIIDGGAWNGDTVEAFIKALAGQCRIFAFEPDSGNYKALCERIAKNHFDQFVVPVARGLWSESGNLKFKTSSDNSMQFQVAVDGDSQIQVVGIDEYFSNKSEKVQLIKMDIEGAEMEALKGGRQKIIDECPSLQICLYHNKEDLWEIPLLVKSLVSNYSLYLGHHTQNIFETILYAKCK